MPVSKSSLATVPIITCTLFIAAVAYVGADPELARRAHRNVQVLDGQVTDFRPYEARPVAVEDSVPNASEQTAPGA